MFDPVTGKPCGSMTIVDCQGPPGSPGPQGSRPRGRGYRRGAGWELIFSSDTPGSAVSDFEIVDQIALSRRAGTWGFKKGFF